MAHFCGKIYSYYPNWHKLGTKKGQVIYFRNIYGTNITHRLFIGFKILRNEEFVKLS